MANLRTLETRLAVFSLIGLAVFAPVETIASWQMFGGPRALVHPGYLGSVAGMVLLSLEREASGSQLAHAFAPV